jgi:hypothetical protein
MGFNKQAYHAPLKIGVMMESKAQLIASFVRGDKPRINIVFDYPMKTAKTPCEP